jgi:hexosaminidase
MTFLHSYRFESILLAAALAILTSAAGAREHDIVPLPNKLEFAEGSFQLRDGLPVELEGGDQQARAVVRGFIDMLAAMGGVELEAGELAGGKSGILFKIEDSAAIPGEGYRLEIRRDGISIAATDPTGLFYATQTIRQLLPPDWESREPGRGGGYDLPCLRIEDHPRFPWRGYMLDESRHFFGIETVKRILDMMAFYKLNRFHWHLTDTDGWRIEIRKYPRLTTVGGIGDRSDPERAAQYYTQDQVREVLRYAAERFITVVPEIDMPGHAAAANRAYPEFSGGGSDKYPEFTFNPAKPATIEFLQDVLGEVAELFPGQWIHYGGDEVHFANKQWAADEHVRALMSSEGYDSILQVEHDFNRRMARHISSLGKTTVGWDEIVDAGVNPAETVIMWWRHDRPRQRDKAVERGYQVVLCPRRPYYFDFVQHDSHQKGRRWGGFCPLDMVYEHPKIPEHYSAEQRARVIGVQANLWTEQVAGSERAEFLTFPRLAALAEAAWTEAESKDYEDFKTRLKRQFARYEIWGLNYFDVFAPESTPEVL